MITKLLILLVWGLCLFMAISSRGEAALLWIIISVLVASVITIGNKPRSGK